MTEIVPPDGGTRVGDRARILLDSEDLAVVEFDYPSLRRGPERHVHHHHGDGFYVIRGRLGFLLGPDAEDVPGEPGTLAFAPPGVAHTFRNDVEEPTLFVNIHVPGCDFGKHMLGEIDDFDQHDPPPDGGLPLSDAIVQRDATAGVSHDLIDVAVVTTSGPWSGTGSFYVLDGVLRIDGTDVPARGFVAHGAVEIGPGASPVTFLHLRPARRS